MTIVYVQRSYRVYSSRARSFTPLYVVVEEESWCIEQVGERNHAALLREKKLYLPSTLGAHPSQKLSV